MVKAAEGEIVESAGLDSMASEVAELDAEFTGSAGEPVGGTPADSGADWLMLLVLLRTALAPVWPFVLGIYSDDKLREVADAFVPVAQKYGLNAGGAFEKWGPELRLAMCLGPLVLQTVLAYKVQKLQAEQAAPAEQSQEVKADEIKKGGDNCGQLMPA